MGGRAKKGEGTAEQRWEGVPRGTVVCQHSKRFVVLESRVDDDTEKGKYQGEGGKKGRKGGGG